MSEATKIEWDTTKEITFNEKVNRACNNGENNSNQNIYASMECMSSNDKFPSGNFGESS